MEGGRFMTSLISYTLPCHKREADLIATLPSVIAAANAHPPVEIVVVDYGHPGTLVSLIWACLPTCQEGVTLRSIRVEAQHFHMAHARNVGIKRAQGEIIVAFLADMLVEPDFFVALRTSNADVCKWRETFAFKRAVIHAVGGFDQRMEFYGPEGKELADRLERAGYSIEPFPSKPTQIRTQNAEKVRNYRLPLTKLEMHHLGMDVWRDNQARNVTVANQGVEWGIA